eukprot:3941761-Rhodomonas_salina.1
MSGTDVPARGTTAYALSGPAVTSPVPGNAEAMRSTEEASAVLLLLPGVSAMVPTSTSTPSKSWPTLIGPVLTSGICYARCPVLTWASATAGNCPLLRDSSMVVPEARIKAVEDAFVGTANAAAGPNRVCTASGHGTSVYGAAAVYGGASIYGSISAANAQLQCICFRCSTHVLFQAAALASLPRHTHTHTHTHTLDLAES